MRRMILAIGIGCLLIMLSPVMAQTSTAWELLGILNEARIANGLNPLAMSSQLTSAAQRHSNDMATQDALFHQGSDGTWFWDRVNATGYPLVNGAENVLYRLDASGVGAFFQWQASADHNANMMSPLYVEVGIAYALNATSGRYYFTMVLASRADFLPPTPTAPPLPTITPIASLAPTNTPMPTLTSPPTFSIVATWTPIPTHPPIPTNTPMPMSERAGFIRLMNWLPPAPFSVREVVMVMPTPTPIPPTPLPAQPTITPLPTSTPRPMDLLLVYNNESFTLMNISGRPLYIDGIWFSSPSGEMAGRIWDNGYLTAPLNAFPHGDCLQVWNREYDQLPKPDFCGYRHSWMRLSNEQTFWRNADYFDVYQWENRITTCLVSTGRCEVNLADRLSLPTPVPQVQVNNQTQNQTNNTTNQTTTNPPANANPTRGVADVRLIYSADSFALINTSGRNLNLSGLGFGGEGGVMSISEWDNGYLSRPLYDFPSGDCLQAWQIGLQNPPAKPSDCTWRHAYLTVADYRMFWSSGSAFTVSLGGNVLATCRVSAGVCDFNLP